MSATRLSDAELGRLLRLALPAATPGLRQAIHADVARTRQLRSAPGVIGALLDADFRARRRALLLAAALLVAIGVALAGAIGAIIEHRPPPPIDLSLQAPADLPGFVRSAYGSMPLLPPMTITTTEDGKPLGRILVDAAGAIRIEHFSSPAAATPDMYKIYAGSSMAELLMIDSRPAWYQQDQAISEDPRVFVFAELGGAQSGTGKEHGCEVAISPGEVYSYTPAGAWRYVALDTVAGRPAQHVTCAGVGDLWVDVATRLTLKSQGPRRDSGGWPVAGALRTIEVTAIEPGQPPAPLFEIRPPAGVRVLSDQEYGQQQCVQSGSCLASRGPVITPPPAPGEKPLTAAGELVRLAQGAPLTVGAYVITIAGTNTGMTNQGSRTVVMFDGSSRYRIEKTSQLGTVWEATSVTLIGAGYRYMSETQVDGSTVWRAAPRRGGPYPLGIPATCDAGWQQRGVDVIGGRVADHVGCPGGDPSDAWIDRVTHLVVRMQSADSTTSGTVVQELVDLQLGAPQGVAWDLPAKASVQP